MVEPVKVVQFKCVMCGCVQDQDGRVLKKGKDQEGAVDLKNELADLRKELRELREENKDLREVADRLKKQSDKPANDESIFD